jgi:hypothetical protein
MFIAVISLPPVWRHTSAACRCALLQARPPDAALARCSDHAAAAGFAPIPARDAGIIARLCVPFG